MLLFQTIYHNKSRGFREDGAEYPDLFEIHTIELGKPLSGKDPVDDWIRLFHAKSEEDLAMIGKKSLGLAEAVEALRELSLGRKLCYYFEMRQKARRDRWAEDAYVRDEGIAIVNIQHKPVDFSAIRQYAEGSCRNLFHKKALLPSKLLIYGAASIH